MPIDVMDAIKDVAKQFGSMPEGYVTVELLAKLSTWWQRVWAYHNRWMIYFNSTCAHMYMRMTTCPARHCVYSFLCPGTSRASSPHWNARRNFNSKPGVER